MKVTFENKNFELSGCFQSLITALSVVFENIIFEMYRVKLFFKIFHIQKFPIDYIRSYSVCPQLNIYHLL